MFEKIYDLISIEPFFIVELKNEKKMNFEISKLHKISINVVKRKNIVALAMLTILIILELTFIDSSNLKMALTFFLLFIFIIIHNLYIKQYILVIELKNKKKLKYIVSSRKKLEMKEKILYLRDLQFKHNFKDSVK